MRQLLRAKGIVSIGVKAASTFIMLLVLSTASAESVIPDAYGDPGLYPNRTYINQNLDEYIDPFSGSLQHHSTDIYVPGNGGFDLKVIRSYNSASIDANCPACFKGLAGLGWTIHFGRVLQSSSSTAICQNANPNNVGENPALELMDGSRQLLTYTGQSSPLMLTTQRWRVNCGPDGNTVIAHSPEGTRYDMTQTVSLPGGISAWYASKITDRNGNYATISYTSAGSPEISQITTNDGRIVSFSYLDSGLNSRRISQISSNGQVYRYNYTAVSGVVDTYTLTSVVRPDGRAWSYAYNGQMYSPSAGSYLMNKATYPYGGTITYEYSNVNFDSYYVSGGTQNIIRPAVSKKTSTPGGTWTFSYTPGSLGVYDVTTVKAPSGTTTYRHYGPKYAAEGSGTVWMVGLLMSKDIGGIQTETYTWGKQKLSDEDYFRPNDYLSNRVDTETNAPVLTQKKVTRNGANYTTSYSSFDSYGNPTSIVETGQNGGDRTTTLSYYINTSKWIVKQVQNESFTGSAVTRSFDDNGNLSSINQDGVTISYTYDSEGNLASKTLPRTLTYIYSDYKRGIPQFESQPEGISISRVVSDAGNVTSQTDGEQRTTTYGYDGLNRLTAITYPRGSSVSISYSAPNYAPSKTVTRGGLVEQTAYDGFGNPSRVTLGGIVRTYSFDALGRNTFVSDPDSSSGTTYQYDILDRMTNVTNANSSYRTISYGSATKTVTDERNNSTTYSYRSYGDPKQEFLMSISAPESSANISLARNGKDFITAVTQGGFTRNYGYNSSYYVTSVTNPETGTTVYGRDEAGNMTSRSVGSSGETIYSYDGQNRLTHVAYPDTTPAVTRTYSKTHKLKTVESSAANRVYEYDDNDNLTSDSLTVDGIVLTASYAYNDLDQLFSITYPLSGKVINYSPDNLGRPSQVSGYVNSVSYWPSGQIKQINYANGTATNYGQNSRLWPSSLSTQTSDGAYSVNSSYGYDDVGNLTSINDTADGSYNRTMGYDNIDRLTSISGPWGNGGISYDGTGNIQSSYLGAYNVGRSYDSYNRLSRVSGYRETAYGYDTYGNIVTGSGNSYTYDGAPNLRCINCSDASLKIEYSYDGLNRRISVIKAGIKNYEFYDFQGIPLVEYTPGPSGKLIQYIYLGGKRIAQHVKPT